MRDEHKIYFLSLARKAIADNLGLSWESYKDIALSKPTKSELSDHRGTFVTLSIEGRLRGCIGQITPTEPVSTTIRDNAISAAVHDPRFIALTAEEFYKVNIEISILSKLVQIRYTDYKQMLSKIKQGENGVMIKSSGRSATFLPQVWEDIDTKEEFLTQLCLKARIFPDEWRSGKLEVYTYTVEHFNEKEMGLGV